MKIITEHELRDKFDQMKAKYKTNNNNKNNEYTYEYETVEDKITDTSNKKEITTREDKKKTKDLEYTYEYQTVEDKEENENKIDKNKENRKIKNSKVTEHTKHTNTYPQKVTQKKKGREKKSNKKEHQKTSQTVIKKNDEYTYEYETVEESKKKNDEVEDKENKKNVEYTYEYETVESLKQKKIESKTKANILKEKKKNEKKPIKMDLEKSEGNDEKIKTTPIKHTIDYKNLYSYENQEGPNISDERLNKLKHPFDKIKKEKELFNEYKDLINFDARDKTKKEKNNENKKVTKSKSKGKAKKKTDVNKEKDEYLDNDMKRIKGKIKCKINAGKKLETTPIGLNADEIKDMTEEKEEMSSDISKEDIKKKWKKVEKINEVFNSKEQLKTRKEKIKFSDESWDRMAKLKEAYDEMYTPHGGGRYRDIADLSEDSIEYIRDKKKIKEEILADDHKRIPDEYGNNIYDGEDVKNKFTFPNLYETTTKLTTSTSTTPSTTILSTIKDPFMEAIDEHFGKSSTTIKSTTVSIDKESQQPFEPSQMEYSTIIPKEFQDTEEEDFLKSFEMITRRPTKKPKRTSDERAERRDRKLIYKKRLQELKEVQLKHKNLFLKLRGYEKYTERPKSKGSVSGEDSFDREYLYIKSEKAFRTWLKSNKFRFPQLDETKRKDYEVLLRCWDTDLKKIKQGIPIVTIYPPPTNMDIENSTTEPFIHHDYQVLGAAMSTTTIKTFIDSLEEAYHRQYEELIQNRTFDSLERIIEEREGNQYKMPRINQEEFNKKFWDILLKEEEKDYEKKVKEQKWVERKELLELRHKQSIEGIASVYEKQKWIRSQIRKQFLSKATTLDRKIELDEEGREWFKGVRGITGDLPDEFFLDDRTELPKHLRWRVELPEKDKKRKVEREKRKELELLEQGLLLTTSDPLEIYKRLFVPLELPEWKQGLTTTPKPTTTTGTTAETVHWFIKKHSKYFTDNDRDELMRAYEGMPKRYLTQWMATYLPRCSDFFNIPDDYDPESWQRERDEFFKNKGKRKTSTVDLSWDSSSAVTEEIAVQNYTYPTMKIICENVGNNRTMYFGQLPRATDKDGNFHKIVLDSDYIAQMNDSTEELFPNGEPIKRFRCLRCNETFLQQEEIDAHHKEHLKKEAVIRQHMINNGSYVKPKKTIPPNKSYLFYYYSDAEDMRSDNLPFVPEYPKYG